MNESSSHIEAFEAGASVLLMDEYTAATNSIIRDR
ncbi:P-loop domain-containing protein [cyanobacterium endosymbiont of Rhopalodia gibberula]